MHGMTNAMDDETRSTIDAASKEYMYRQYGSKIQIVLWSLSVFMLWALKVCVAIFYSRLTSGLPNLQHRVHFAYILLAGTYAAASLTIFLSCRPMSKFWQITPDPGNSCQPAISRPYVLVVVIPTIFVNIYLLFIPLPMLWKINITRWRKFVLISLFSGAIWSMMMGLIRAVIILQGGPNAVGSGSVWACRETFVAIVVTNLPILQPLFRECIKRLRSSNAITSRNSEQLTSSGKHQRYRLTYNRAFSRPATSPPITNAWDSGERILSISHDQTRASTVAKLPPEDIVVDQEIIVISEPAATAKPQFLSQEALGFGSER
ncbi:uncharacterized protein F4812DRAFT_465724 [Daldinia caldariorum]|uniref:uncharacterized protein n=1 Tax=Daldinia caldariorum TaxID=326644 RepID=UPI00200892EB|nr:uncharacterized protein F4812DRAFT_465724 [Daldinia caldariorum]KAI1466475.1 hypothetical protein F4812DRAFT_465724 [Daldinia caldariorum]